MPTFTYQAYTSDGHVTSGRLEAPREADALQKLSLQGLLAFKATEVRPSAWRKERRVSSALKPSELSLVLRALAVLLEAAIPLDKALRLAAEQSGNTRRRGLLDRLHEAVIAGRSLSEAMADQETTFHPSHLAIVRAGEMSGSLEPVLKDLSVTVDRQVELRGRVASAAVYPAILLLMAAAALCLVVLVMAPALAPLFDGDSASVPLVISVAMAVSKFLRDFGAIAPAAIALSLAILLPLMRTEGFKKRRDRLFLTLPLVGSMVRAAEAARFGRVLAILLRSGAPLPQSLSVTADALENRTCKASLQNAVEGLKKGAKPIDALQSFNALTAPSRSLLAIGEESNRLPDMLSKVADLNEKALEQTIDRLMAILTPALTITIGVVVGGLIISVMNAILSLNDLAL